MKMSLITRLITLLAISLPVAAQTGSAAINGTVTDAQGAVLAGATVLAMHETTNVVYRTVTTPSGVYTIPALPVGPYRITVEADGFKRESRRGILLRVSDNVRTDFQMAIGAVTETVEVTGQAALVDSSSATINKVVESRRLVDLPLNGRSALSMVVLTPNVRSSNVSAQGFADRGANVSSFSVNGGPMSYNNLTLDGASNNNARNYDSNVNPAVDAVEEFKVESGVMSAEHGFTLGGVVSLVTKSGTNQFHGSLYEFLRNDALDARNTFATRRPPLRYNQFGGAIGGPIRRDKTFFFGNYEGWILRNYYTVNATTPTNALRSGDFSQFRNNQGALIPIFDPNSTAANPAGTGFVRSPFPGNVIPTQRLDPVAQNILKVYPQPNTTPTNAFTNANNFAGNFDARSSARQFTTKIDQHFAASNRLGFRYSYWQHLDDQAANSTPYFDYEYRTRNDNYKNFNFVLEDTHTFSPRLLNTFRTALSRQNFLFEPGTSGTNPVTKFGLPANVPDVVAPIITIADSPAIQTFPRTAFSSPGNIGMYTWQIQDSVNWIAGRHSIKMGVDFRKNLYAIYLTAAISGQYNFNSRLTANPQSLAGTGSGLASFALGSVATATIDSNIGVSYPSSSYAAFIQDDIKLTRTFTLNLGLRYDYQQIPWERHNGISVFNATSINSLNNLPGRLDFAGQDFQGAPIDPDRNDFGPRAGFAWDVLGNGSTVLRGGYGIYYPFIFPITAGGNGYPSLGFTNNFTNYNPPGNNIDLPAFQLQGGLPTPPIPPLGSAVRPSAFYSQNVSSIQRNDRTPYSQQFTLSLQRQLRGGYLVEASYSGNKGTKLAGASYDYNQMDPRLLSLGSSLLDNVPNPYAGQVTGSFGGASIQRRQLLRPLPYYGNISITNPHDASSIYHSFLLNVEKRFSRGLVFLASYTFGKSISDGVTGKAGVAEQINVTDFQSGRYNRAVERAIDPTDSASRFVTSGVYELPFGPNKAVNSSIGFVNRLIEGWQVNGVLVLQSGFPLVIRGANNNAANRPDSTGVSAALPSGEQSVARWFRSDVFVNPVPFTFGNVGRTLPDVRGPGTTNVDFSLIKNTRITEKFRLQFRAEAFNALNHANYRLPNTTFTPDAQGRNANPNFGVITAARDARIVQLGLKLLF
jgi:hypothetical protein